MHHDALSAPVRVLLVDHHDLFRTGLATMLGTQPEIELLAQASTGRLAVQLAGELAPDVILMDLALPDVDGIDVMRATLEANPETAVVVLSMASDEKLIQAAVRSGARGFVDKEASIASVVAAIEAAAQRASWLSPAAAELVLESARREWATNTAWTATHDGLSPRELDVLALIAHGLDNAQIGEALHISPRTVKNHVSSILAKLDLASRLQAAVYAVRNGLAGEVQVTPASSRAVRSGL